MESKRLLFREINIADAEMIVKWRSDPSDYKYFLSPHKLTLSEHIDWFNNKYLNDQNRTDYIAIEKSVNFPVGIFGIVINEDTVEVNYLLDKNYRGFGYALEAVEYLLSYAKTSKKCIKAIAEIHKNNNASIELVKRLAFVRVAENGNILLFEKKL